MIDLKATGKNIRLKMLHNDVTVERMGSELGISSQAVYKWLRGECLPSLESLYRASKVLNCHMENLIIMKEGEDSSLL